MPPFPQYNLNGLFGAGGPMFPGMQGGVGNPTPNMPANPWAGFQGGPMFPNTGAPPTTVPVGGMQPNPGVTPPQYMGGPVAGEPNTGITPPNMMQPRPGMLPPRVGFGSFGAQPQPGGFGLGRPFSFASMR